MINVKDNEWIPSSGYRYISNGSVWTERILLGRSDSIANWHDTNEEPPEEEDIPDSEALEIITGGTANDES